MNGEIEIRAGRWKISTVLGTVAVTTAILSAFVGMISWGVRIDDRALENQRRLEKVETNIDRLDHKLDRKADKVYGPEWPR